MNQAAENSDDRQPAYVQLRDALTSRIVSGEWMPDQALPSESRLADYYQVSIGTLRKAVDGLVDEALLERRQGAGTYVRTPSFDRTLFRFFQIRDARGECASIPSSHLLLRAVVRAPREARKALGTSDVIKIVRLRSLSDEPILFERIYIPRERFSGFETMPKEELGPLLYPIYFKAFGVLVKSATDDLSFGRANVETAKRLKIDRGEAIAVIHRTAFDVSGNALEWRVAHGSALRFNYRSEIR
jgi:GntR family transcriptional regulator